MPNKNRTFESILNEGLTTEPASIIFDEVIDDVEDSKYHKNLKELFYFALNNGPSLFTGISVPDSDNPLIMAKIYLTKWCNKYIRDRNNPALKKPLKTFGEKDAALTTRVAANANIDDQKVLNDYLRGHFLYMSAENMNGSILEEYLAEVLEPEGWIWCAGSVYRAVDFCYLGTSPILLQVKNKYNTESSSSSAIRVGTTIRKWNRLNKSTKISGLDSPIPNWKALIEMTEASKELAAKLTENSYL
ncbi:TPA: SinI family restriction endonuclease, partial [Enterococcus faecium]|nr:SinI family restriction endonuclease [Enterococcus faecium]HAQ1732192.1 SinI family restriction endonuclease [Enterococcus faecium]HBL1813410.1 SinI family restriction endonuclease [Enterococcus faecium]HBL1850084.1 SinI family restriction endonuclease [Enterococcus faecium]HBL1963231.1 SinI family restriction endonuclease [Enterococcus faecium]